MSRDTHTQPLLFSCACNHSVFLVFAGLKGVEFNIAILEEASIIPPSVMESFAPCLGVNYAVFIAITTALDEDNYISVLFNNEDEQARQLFIRIHVELWCKKCKIQGISADTCMKLGHENDKIVTWKSSKNNEQVIKLMPQADLIESEIAGSIRTRKPVFDKKWIQALAEHAKNPIRLPPNSFDFIFTFIDPSGGGSQSDLAIVSIGILRSKQIVVTGISRDSNPHEMAEAKTVRAHFQELRTLAMCREAVFVIFVENNYGGGPAAGRIMSCAADYAPIVRINEIFSKPGVQTTDITNEEAVSYGVSELSNGNIRFAAEMACSTPDDYNKIRDEFITQLSRIHKKVNTRKNGNHTFSYTGKSKGQKDDMGFGLLRCMRWTNQFRQREEYEKMSAWSRAGTTKF